MQFLHENWQVEQLHVLHGVLRKHRHVLLAPAFFVAVLVMLHSATMDSRVGDVPSAMIGQSGVEDLGDGVQVQVTRTSTYSATPEKISLHQGSMLLRSRGMVRVGVSASGSVTGWNGGLALLRSHNTLTVAALTTPAIVRFGSGTLLVPQGMQAKIPMQQATSSGVTTASLLASALPGALPEAYIKDQVKRLSAFGIPKVAPVRTAVTVGAVLKGDVMDEVAERKDALMTAVMNDDATSVIRMVREDGLSLFEGADGQQLLSVVIAQSASPSVRASLLPFAVSADLRLLLAIHPDTREEGLLAVDTSLPGGDALLLELPLFDLAPDALPEWISSRFTRQVASSLARSRDPLASLRQFYVILQASMEHMQKHGYANRSERYSALAEELASPYKTLFTDEQRSILGSVLELNKPLPAIEKKETEASSTPALRRLSSEESESAQLNARALLLSHGAMLTRDTEFSATYEGTVEVENIVFATGSGDELFSFDFHPQTQSLSAIVRSGQKQSYGVTVEEFLSWIKQ